MAWWKKFPTWWNRWRRPYNPTWSTQTWCSQLPIGDRRWIGRWDGFRGVWKEGNQTRRSGQMRNGSMSQQMSWQEEHGRQHYHHWYHQLQVGPTTTLPFDSHNAARSKCCIRRSHIRIMWHADYLEESPSTREKRKWWKQQNTHQHRWVSLIIRQWIQGQRNSEIHHKLEYIGQNIRANSGTQRRRPTSSIIRYRQHADAATKGRLKQYDT